MSFETKTLVEKYRRLAGEAVSGSTVRRTLPTFHVCGLNHTRASVELRELYSMDEPAAGRMIQHIRELGLGEQVMVLSTCNRTEVYLWSHESNVEQALRETFLALGEASCPESGPPPIYQYVGMEAVRHLLAVAAGLDSMILGENQIKNQLRNAHRIAREMDCDGPELSRVIDKAFSTAKRIKTETKLNTGTLCVGKAAVLQAEKRLEGLAGRKCLVIGAGKIGRIAASALAERELGELWIVNRTQSKAMALSRELGGQGFGLEALPELMAQADVIIGAAYAPDMLVHAGQMRGLLPQDGPIRRVAMVDVAVPRMIDPAVGELSGVTLDNIEMMEEIVEANRRQRQKEAARAWRIVEQEVENFRTAQAMTTLAPRIRQLQANLDRIFTEEFGEVAGLDERMRAKLHRVKQRVMHEVITDMKASLSV